MTAPTGPLEEADIERATCKACGMGVHRYRSADGREGSGWEHDDGNTYRHIIEPVGVPAAAPDQPDEGPVVVMAVPDQAMATPRCGHGHGPLMELHEVGWRCPSCFPEMFFAEIERLRAEVVRLAEFERRQSAADNGMTYP